MHTGIQIADLCSRNGLVKIMVQRSQSTMILVLLIFLMKTRISVSWPIAAGAWPDAALAFDLTSDYPDPSYGPLSLDYLRSNRFMGPGSRLPWPFDRYPYGDAWDPYYGGYPRSTDVTKENYVRDYPYGGTEFGVRDSVTYRPGGVQAPWSRFYPGYGGPAFPQSPYWPKWGGMRSLDRFFYPFFSSYDSETPWERFYPHRRMMASQLSNARPSSLRFGGDMTYLKR